MGFFKNLFACSFQSPDEDNIIKANMNQIQLDIKKIENDINTLFRVKTDINELKRLEDKLNNHFALLSTKIDNIILILNSRA